MSLFDLKPASMKIIFAAFFIFLIVFAILPNITEFIKSMSHAPIVYIFFVLPVFVSAALLAGGVSLFFNEIFIRNHFKISLELLTGFLSLATFVFVLFKFPGDYPRIFAVFILPVTNLFLTLYFSKWLILKQDLSLPLALLYACLMFFFNFNSFFSFLNRFAYWEGEDAASSGVLLIFVMPVAVVVLLIYLIIIKKINSPATASRDGS